MSAVESWKVIQLSQLFTPKNDKSKQVKSSEYQIIGTYPVIDQSSKFICGYHDNQKYVIKSELPYIVFGDHTRHTKYIDFPFIAGADGTQILKADPNNYAKFLYYVVSDASEKIGNFGYDRHFKHLKEFYCYIPESIEEQIKIAEILSTLDQAIEQTEAIIAKQQRIKTGLMQDLLTKGIDENGNIRSEATHEFKDSSLGRIPVEWDDMPLSAVADLQVGYAFKSTKFAEDGIKLLRGENVGVGHPDWKDTKFLSTALAHHYDEFQLVEGDLIIGMDRTFTKQGCKISVISSSDIPSLLVQRVGKFVQISVTNDYLAILVNSELYQQQLLLQQKGMDIPHLSKGEILSVLVPTPDKCEQDRISHSYKNLRKFTSIQEESLLKLNRLKKGLMHDLLTGKVRVADTNNTTSTPESL